VDYKSLERPAIIRNRIDPHEALAGTNSRTDYLDIPAFLRRQAD